MLAYIGYKVLEKHGYRIGLLAKDLGLHGDLIVEWISYTQILSHN
jgi:hypothetical protein